MADLCILKQLGASLIDLGIARWNFLNSVFEP